MGSTLKTADSSANTPYLRSIGHRSQKKEEEPSQFTAFEWEEMDREVDRDWYTFDEGCLVEDGDPEK